MSGLPDVTIVIPTFNRLDLTVQCLESIERETPAGLYELVVVDNASSDGTPAYLRAQEEAGRLRAVLNPENLGFGKACNQGAALAGGRYVLLLNSDTVAQPRWLEAMVACADGAAEIGVVGSRLVYPDWSIQHAGIVFNAQVLPDHVHRGVAPDDPAVLEERDYPAVTGACMLVRRELYERLGGFDETYRMYVEDVDLCLRAWDAGYRVTYCPASLLVHHESASVPDLERRDALVLDGCLKLHQRWAGRWPAQALAEPRRRAVDGARAFVVLAFAEELVASPDLLRAYGAAFGGKDDATLVVGLPPDDPGPALARLEAAVEAAGLGGEEAADLLALPLPADASGAPALAASVDAALSHRRLLGALGRPPRFGAAGIAQLRTLAEQSWATRAA